MRRGDVMEDNKNTNHTAGINNDPHLDVQGRLNDDYICLQCGYNLRSLLPDARCPECGTAIRQSLAGMIIKDQNNQQLGWIKTGVNLLWVGNILLWSSCFILPLGIVALNLVNAIVASLFACFWLMLAPGLMWLGTVYLQRRELKNHPAIIPITWLSGGLVVICLPLAIYLPTYIDFYELSIQVGAITIICLYIWSISLHQSLEHLIGQCLDLDLIGQGKITFRCFWGLAIVSGLALLLVSAIFLFPMLREIPGFTKLTFIIATISLPLLLMWAIGFFALLSDLRLFLNAGGVRREN